MERCKCPKQIAWVERKRQFDSSIWQKVEFLRSVHFFICYAKKCFTQIYRALYGEGHQHDGWKPLDRNICLQCRIQGRGPGDLGLPLFSSWGPKGRKNFFGRPAPFLIWGSGWPPPPDPKVWIRHWFVTESCHESVNSSLEEHKNIKVMLFLLEELFR